MFGRRERAPRRRRDEGYEYDDEYRGANGGDHDRGYNRGPGYSEGSRIRERRVDRPSRRSEGRRRVDPDRRAAGYKAAISNPNTTHDGRARAKDELRAMGRGYEAHGRPSLSSRIRHFLGIRARSTRREEAGGRSGRREHDYAY